MQNSMCILLERSMVLLSKLNILHIHRLGMEVGCKYTILKGNRLIGDQHYIHSEP